MARQLSGRKVHKTALALLPPEDLWEPIQAIRRKHDKHLSRWPQPHVNLLYPFVPGADFEAAAAVLKPVLARTPCFRIKLRRFQYFVHGRRSATLWLDPECEPPSALDELQKALTDAIPFANDLRERFDGKFSGHITVGQFPGEAAVQGLQPTFQDRWEEVEFTVDRLVFLSRENSPEDRFRIERTLEIGSNSTGHSGKLAASPKLPVTKPKTSQQSMSKPANVTASASASARVDLRPSCATGDVKPLGVASADTLTDEELSVREAAVVNVLTGMVA